MDETELQTIEARANAATPGPWVRASATATRDIESTCGVTGVDLDGVTPWFEPDLCVEVQGGEEHHAADIDFIVHARTDVPALVAEVRRLTAEVEMLRGVGCSEMDGGEMRGPCGVCLKCARRERDDARAALATARREGAEEMRERCSVRCEELAEQESSLAHAAEERGDQHSAAIHRHRGIARLQAAADIRALPLDAPGGAT